MVIADKAKKFSKPRKFEDLKNVSCIWHLGSSHTTGDYRFFIEWYTRKDNKGDKKEDHQKKDDDDQRDKGF
jgi:O-glycosyl hydrolase